MKGMRLAAIIGCIAVAMMGVSARADSDLNKVIDKALNNKEVKDIEVDGKHHFHVKPITVVKSPDGKKKIAIGLLSHVRSHEPDDQIKYRITWEDGKEPAFDVKIDKGGLGQYLPLPDKVKNAAGRMIMGDWELSAQRVIDVVAAKLQVM